jgi:hypothetical protein
MFDSRNRHPRPLVAALTMLLCFAGLAPASEAGAPSGPDSRTAPPGHSPVGVWKLHVTFVTCDTGAAIRLPFPALYTFYGDGNVSETSSGLGPAFRSVSHGRWLWTGKNTLAIKTELQLFDPNFIYYADQVFDRRFELSVGGETLTGKTTYVRYATDGSVLFRGCSTEEGTRQAAPSR